MVTDTLDIVNKFVGDTFFKLWCQLVNGAGEHKVLPDDQTKLVTKVKKEIIGIVAATPDTDAVKVGKLTVL